MAMGQSGMNCELVLYSRTSAGFWKKFAVNGTLSERSLTAWADAMNQKLAVEKLKPLFFGNSCADRQHGVLLKFNHLIAAGTNQMVMVGRAGTIEFVVLRAYLECLIL